MQMKKIQFIFFYLFLSLTQCFSQTLYGTNNYVEYQVGNLPIVISVPHGGDLSPTSIPTRICNNPETVTDSFTIETAEQIKAALFLATGCYPHVIICNLKRTKLDCNRNLADGACDNSQAMTAWNEYHNFITMAQNTANSQYNNKILFVDLHGHGHTIQRIELGYLLSASDLELSETTLNSTAYINQSSIKNLVLNNRNNYTHTQLLRGPSSFGTLLTNLGFPAVPSQQIPYPGATASYFSGGYTTASHTCFDPTITTNGFQMELNYDGVRNSNSNRILFADKFKNAVLEYLNTHTNVVLGNCASLSTDENKESELIFYPNPVNDVLNLSYIQEMNVVKVYNLVGQELLRKKVNSSTAQIDISNFANGTYFIQVTTETAMKTVRVIKR
jgi:N-formylglutamate amidohydrolase